MDLAELDRFGTVYLAESIQGRVNSVNSKFMLIGFKNYDLKCWIRLSQCLSSYTLKLLSSES